MRDRTGDGASAIRVIVFLLCFITAIATTSSSSCAFLQMMSLSGFVVSWFYHSVDVVLCITASVWFWRFMIPIPVPVSIAFNGVLSWENRFMMMFQEQRNIRSPWSTGGTLGNIVKEEWKKLQESCDLNLHYPFLPLAMGYTLQKMVSLFMVFCGGFLSITRGVNRIRVTLYHIELSL